MHQRTKMLIGEEGFAKLQQATVAVCGVGGVGSYVAESLARSGIGKLLLIDHDEVSLSNCNRQLEAVFDNLGNPKAQEMAKRLQSIHPDVKAEAMALFLDTNTPSQLFAGCDYIVDAVDNVTAKLRLIEIAHELNIPILSAMGCGNKLDPSKLVVTDLYKTNTCPLCRVMRRECKARGIKKLKVVYSTELPQKPIWEGEGKAPPASMVFVPGSAGLLMGSVVVRDLMEK